MMKKLRYWALSLATVLLIASPLQSANAWDGRGYRGHNGYWHGGYSGRHWDGGPRYHRRGCRNCDSVGAAIVGLAIGGIIGSAMTQATQPPARYPRYYSAPDRCTPVVIDGATYYDCDRAYQNRYSERNW